MDAAKLKAEPEPRAGEQRGLQLFPGWDECESGDECGEGLQTAQTLSFGDSVHGTISPMYAPAASEPDVDWAAIAAGEQRRIEVPEDQRERFALTHTIREFYGHAVYGLAAIRRQAVKDEKLAGASVVKDLQAINRWERFSPRLASWPAGRPWQGRPLAAITDVHVNETLAAMRGKLAGETVKSTWNHLRTIFNRAVEVKAIPRAPEPTWGRDSGDRVAKQLYTDPQLGEIYAALAGHVDLQIAFVVSVNVGPRTVDLFLLRWEDLDLARERAVVEYVARKTGKRHVVPLAEVTVRQLERWARHSGLLPLAGASGYSGLVWPQLTDATAAEPEQSRAARRRNARFKSVLKRLGLEHAKPWQVGRLTCNERLERHRPGSGQFVLGHANSLNSVSYREPSGLVYEAVTTLPQPECFHVV